jgi:long-subunit fatty acid transport protein
VALKQRITGTLEGTVDATLTRIPVRYQFESIAMIGFLPREFRLGTSVRAVERLTLNLDLVWQDWSGYPSPVASSAATLEAQVPPGLMIDLPEDSPHETPVSPGFEDRIVPRLGIESTFPAMPNMSLAFRVGYAYEESPAARHQLSTALIDADRHLVSFGTGFVWTRPAPWLPHTIRFDSHALFARLIERAMQVEVDGKSQGISASGAVWSVGATFGLGFE